MPSPLDGMGWVGSYFPLKAHSTGLVGKRGGELPPSRETEKYTPTHPQNHTHMLSAHWPLGGRDRKLHSHIPIDIMYSRNFSGMYICMQYIYIFARIPDARYSEENSVNAQALRLSKSLNPQNSW